jgi:glycosyltransferase involved in cell wall biosynthesis
VPDTGPTREPTVSVIVPAMNEAENLPHVLGAIPDDTWEVILVDGRSTDGTVSVAKALCPDVVVVHQTGIGKGNALACGFAAASGDIVVMIDADASMDPTEIPAFVDAVAACPGSYAKGSRVVPSGGSDDLTVIRRLGNRMLVSLVNSLFGTGYTDLCYGFIAFWRRDLDVLGFAPSRPGRVAAAHRNLGFEVETYLNIRAALGGLRIVEVPSFERKRAYGASNLRVVRDGLRVLRTIVVERLGARAARSAAPVAPVRPVGPVPPVRPGVRSRPSGSFEAGSRLRELLGSERSG